MILLNKIIAKVPSRSSIDSWMSDIEYTGYIPYDFIIDLYSLWSNLIFNKPLLDFIVIESDYDKSFLEVAKLITSITKFKLTGKEFVQQVILFTKAKMSFRAIELAKLNKIAFKISKDDNIKFELGELPDIVIDTLLKGELKEDTLLTPETLKVLNLLNKLDNLPGNLYTEAVFSRTQMTHYSQVAKSIKHQLVSPLFNVKFATKSLNIKYPNIDRSKQAEVIILIDCSTSIIGDNLYEVLKRAVILHYIKKYSSELHITIYFYARFVVKKIVITNINQLQAVYWNPIETVTQIRGSNPVINEIEGLYTKSNVVFINDGKDIFSENISYNNRWHIVTIKHNKYLNQIASNSLGTYININEIK